MAIWRLVAQGEILDNEGTERWTIDWGAFREGRETEHPLFTEDAPDELWEALLFVRSERSRPALEAHEAAQADGVTADDVV